MMMMIMMIAGPGIVDDSCWNLQKEQIEWPWLAGIAGMLFTN